MESKRTELNDFLVANGLTTEHLPPEACFYHDGALVLTLTGKELDLIHTQEEMIAALKEKLGL